MKLSNCDPNQTEDLKKNAAVEEIAAISKQIDDLVYRLYAEGKQSLLIVLQGMDTSGKDGAIRSLTSGINPQACVVTSFKKPSIEELSHHFLWRINKAIPKKGTIGIFNRSHYEDVLVVRVHDIVPKSVWKARYAEINDFERTLTDSGTKVLKFFLHIDKDEQKERLQARLDDPERRWKFSPGDLEERKYWDAYQEASQDMIDLCSPKNAPWIVVPANKKWNRNLIVNRHVLEALMQMDPKFPDPIPGVEKLEID